MGMYEDLHNMNVIRPIIDRIKPGYFEPVEKPDGTYRLKNVQYTNPKNPWILTRRIKDRLCDFWYDVIFQDYGMLPHGCTGCWKVCMKLDTLEQLMKTLALQKRLDLPAKCGMDERPWTDCLYSAYWYVPYQDGLEGGRKLWKLIKKEVHKHVDPKINVILKRA